MRRSWIALIVVVVIIVVAVIVASSPPSETTVPEPDKPTTKAPAPSTDVAPPKPATDAAVTPRPETATAPKPTTAVAPPKPEPPKTDALLQQAEAQVAAGKPVDAMKALSAALLGPAPPADPKPVKERLAKLAAEVLFSSKPCPPFSTTHDVVSGDSLWKIARQHKTTVDLLQRLNGLKGDAIRVGQKLKVIPGGFDVEVVKSQFRLTVTKGGVWVREFAVGLGKDGATPVGSFAAGQKLKEPTWFGNGAPVPFEDKKNNPLGTRWITIQGAGAGEYGIHGTWEPESMGKEMSKGCVRMLNADVEWLFALIVSDESKIVIKP